MSIEFDYLLKFIIIGDSSVGKSNIISQYKEGKFDEGTQPSIGVQFIAKNVELDQKIFRLQIWDTAGQENFRAMTKIYYKNSSCAFIVYDITEKDTFHHVESWIKECKKVAPETILFVLIGNKNDLDEKRDITYDEGKNFAQKHNMLFFETSAKNGNNIDEIFKESVEYINNNIKEGKYDLTDDSCGVKICKSQSFINIDEFEYESTQGRQTKKKKKGKCC
jgi:small GTP-binding protein